MSCHTGSGLLVIDLLQNKGYAGSNDDDDYGSDDNNDDDDGGGNNDNNGDGDDNEKKCCTISREASKMLQMDTSSEQFGLVLSKDKMRIGANGYNFIQR